ncbi:MAG: hypothetical protein Q8K70_08565 [Bacteroidota bacterium]|nr:hypothetical protein [Bacteroidota bacterium]
MKKVILKPVLTLTFLMLIVLKINAQMTPCTTPPDPPCDPNCMEIEVVNNIPCDLDFFWGYSGCSYIIPAKKIFAGGGCTPQNCSSGPGCGVGTNPPCCCSNDPLTCGTPGNLPCCTPGNPTINPNNNCKMYGPCAKCPDNPNCECPNRIFILTSSTPEFFPWGDFQTMVNNGNSTYLMYPPQNFCSGCTNGVRIEVIVTSTNTARFEFYCIP